MDIYTMNGSKFGRNTTMNGNFSRTTTVNDHNRQYSTDDYPNDYGMNDHDDDNGEWMETEFTEDEVMDGLSRMEVMSDEELSDELGKFRIRFGKGKGKKKRKQRRHLRRAAKKANIEKKKHGRHIRRKGRKERREKALSKFGSFVKDVAGKFGGGKANGETEARLQLQDAEMEADQSWWDKDAFLGMTNKQAVWAGSGVVALGITGRIIYMNTGARAKKKKKRA